MKAKLHEVLRYFSKFGYRPTPDEIHTFFPTKIHKNRLKGYLNNTYKYTLGGYNITSKVKSQRSKVSLDKMARVRKYLDFISRLPQIRLIGFSGSVAMLNAKNKDDVDLFIITARNRIWTVRFIVNFAAWAFGLKRKRYEVQAQNKVCLNLFFDESSLFIPKKYHSNYMAHEVLQMVPILDVNRSYRRFLLRNDWVLEFFPNVRLKRYLPHHSSSVVRETNSRTDTSFVHFGNVLEAILKKMQLIYMSKPRGDERIERGQLWFHPRDYGRTVGK